MITGLLVSLVASVSAQSYARPLPTGMDFCNETPASVTYSVTRPTGRTGRTQHGWFTVEPGACRQGLIGDGVSGTAFVHARSGNLVWPAGRGERLCVPANSHQRAAREPSCPSGERAEHHDRVLIESTRSRHTIRHRVSCPDLGARNGAICEAGRRDRNGFLEIVRTLEVCNRGNAPFEIATAGETRDGQAWRVSGWREIPAGLCVDAWRGQSASGRVHVRARDSDGEPVWDRDDARFCIAEAGDSDFVRIAADYFETECADEGEGPAGFRTVQFDRGVGRFSLDFRGAYDG